MDFSYTDEQMILKKTLRRYFDDKVIPLVEKYESKGKFPPMELIQEVGSYGYLGNLISQEDGGQDLGQQTHFIMIEELSRAWPSLRSIISISNMVLTLISKWGTKDQKEKYLSDLLTGKKIGFMGLTEPNIGSDATHVETTATKKGDRWILNGRKTFISHGSKGDLGVVYATVEKGAGSKAVTAFIVDKNQTKYDSTLIPKMGMHSSPLSELIFEDSEVPEDNILGGVGNGFKLASNFLNSGRCMVAAVCVGVAQAALDASVNYSKSRVQFGKPIAAFQLVQEMLAEMSILVQSSRLMGMNAAWVLDQGNDARYECSAAKLFSSEASLKVTEKAIQVHGGAGYTKLFPVERYYRDIRHLTIAEGTSQIQKLMLGRGLTGIDTIRG